MGKKHREGFTLIELLVLMMVAALTLGLGVPAFRSLSATSHMSAAANILVSSVHSARAEALTRSRSVTLCASSDWDDESPRCDAAAPLLAGWIMFVDANSNGVRDADEQLLQVNGPVHNTILEQPRTMADREAPQYLSFRADGFLQDIAGLGPGVNNLQLCDERGNGDTGSGRAAGRWITLSPAGRPTLIDSITVLQSSSNPLGGCE